MTVSQVGRTTNSVTINISEITEGDRQTYIWIPDNFNDPFTGKPYTLSAAKNAGYIDYYVPDETQNNGIIEVYPQNDYLERGGKLLWLGVENINTSSGDTGRAGLATLGFEYERTSVKKRGADVDITVSDINEISCFVESYYRWVLIENISIEKLPEAYKGSPIYAHYLQTPASYLYNVVSRAEPLFNANGDGADSLEKVYEVKENCISEADFKAEWFNNIADVIGNFMKHIAFRPGTLL